MPFVRVRGKQPGDPLHEYDVAEAEAARHPDVYEVLDPEPVPAPRETKFVDGVVKAPRAPRAKKTTQPAKKRTATRSGETNNAPAGADS